MNMTVPSPNGQESTYTELFALYGRLVAPVRAFEDAADRKHNAEATLGQAQSTVASAWLMPFVSGLSRALLLAIPFIVVFLIVCNVKTNAEGVKWIALYDEWCGQQWLAVWFNKVISPETTPLWLGIPLTFIHYLLIENAVAPVVLFLLPATILFSVFTTVFSVIAAKGTIAAKRQEIATLQDELDARLAALDLPISFVPPDYRSSAALEYFARSFANGKVKTLQEATAAYDTYQHQQRMEQGQLELLDAQDAILRQIRYQTSEISKLKGKLDSVKNKVDWL